VTMLLDAQGIAIHDRLDLTDVQCAAGELIAVIGPNGAGKTSLLRALAGIETDSGRVLVEGEDVLAAPPARRIHMLTFLSATRSVVWPISARDVIALGLPNADACRIERLIKMFELGPLADRPVNQLSTGERSRVLLARVLAPRPRLLLLDEPLSYLDPYWVLRTLEILRGAASEGCAVLASLHHLSHTQSFDRVLLIDRGGVAADGRPQQILDSLALAEAFRIEPSLQGWRIRENLSSRADPQSLR
jgi:iron complex transport system ATP-binding protein